MQGHCLRRRPPLSWYLVEKLMKIKYLNHPPYPNRWMITLIQQGSVCDLESSEPGCQEDASRLLSTQLSLKFIFV